MTDHGWNQQKPRRFRTNVYDRRTGDIRAFETEPLVYDELKPEHVGRTVIYRAAWCFAEAGTLTSWRDGIVFARYSTGDTAAGALPEHLEFAVR